MEEISLPDSITSIEYGTFSQCFKLKKITIGALVKYIAYGAFFNCYSLETLTIPGSVETIDWFLVDSYNAESFVRGCDKLKKIKLLYDKSTLAGVTLISDSKHTKTENGGYRIDNIKSVPLESLFIDRSIKWGKSDYCNPTLKGIKDLTLGEHYNDYSDLRISSMSDLEHVTSYSIKPPKIGSCTNSQYLNVVVKVPNDALEAYKNADVWKNFWTIEGFDPSGVESIDSESPEKFEIGRYDINGREVSQDYEGIVIIKYSDGSAKKLISHKA